MCVCVCVSVSVCVTESLTVSLISAKFAHFFVVNACVICNHLLGLLVCVVYFILT